MIARRARSAVTAGLLAALLWMPTTTSAQMILTQTAANDGIMVFPSPTTGLPNPAEIPVTGLPAARRPHGATCVSSTTCLAADFLGSVNNDPGQQRIFIIDVPTATVTGTLQTAGTYSGGGTLAVNRARTHVLGTNTGTPGIIPNPGLAVIATPVTPASAAAFVPLPGYSVNFSTSSIVFDGTDRAYVCYGNGIAILEPPYTSVLVNIPLAGPVCPSLAVTLDGSKLLVPEFAAGAADGIVRIFTAPFTAQSTFETVTVPGGSNSNQLQGIAISPDNTTALVVSALNGGKVFAVHAPFNAASLVEQLPLPAQFTAGFEDVTFSNDGQFAVIMGNGSGQQFMPYIQAPFTAAGMTVFTVSGGGRARQWRRSVRPVDSARVWPVQPRAVRAIHPERRTPDRHAPRAARHRDPASEPLGAAGLSRDRVRVRHQRR